MTIFQSLRALEFESRKATGYRLVMIENEIARLRSLLARAAR